MVVLLFLSGPKPWKSTRLIRYLLFFRYQQERSKMDEVLKIIQSIPAGSNPYSFLASKHAAISCSSGHSFAMADFMRNNLLPDTGKVLSINLIVCSVLFVIALFFAVVLLWGKIWFSETWLFKKKDTALGLLWLPNSGFLWAVVSPRFLLRIWH